MPRLTLIGAGRLAKGLGRLWSLSGTLRIVDVLSCHAQTSEAAVDSIGGGRPLTDYRLLEPADLFLIATPDRALSQAVAELAKTGLVDSNAIVFHCSGAESSALLGPARGCGASVASVHPIMSFTDKPLSAAEFAGVMCAIEGDERAVRATSQAFSAIGGRVVRIEPDQKILYHAGAVMGSNYLVTLLARALEVYDLAGIDRALGLAMLGPLARQTLENLLRDGPQAALSGPIVRGDAELVQRQYAALKSADVQLASLYRAFAAETARLAGRPDPLE